MGSLSQRQNFHELELASKKKEKVRRASQHDAVVRKHMDHQNTAYPFTRNQHGLLRLRCALAAPHRWDSAAAAEHRGMDQLAEDFFGDCAHSTRRSRPLAGGTNFCTRLQKPILPCTSSAYAWDTCRLSSASSGSFASRPSESSPTKSPKPKCSRKTRVTANAS